MTHVTCRLTAKNRDQLRNPALGNRVWATFTFFCCRYIKGFITRAGEPTDENQRFIRYMKYNYLTTLKKKLPSSVLDKSWPASPVALQQVNFRAVQVMKSLHAPPGVRNKSRVIVDNVRQYDREQKCFPTLTEGRQRRGRDHVVRQTAADGGSGDREGPTADGRHFDGRTSGRLVRGGNADQADRRHEPVVNTFTVSTSVLL